LSAAVCSFIEPSVSQLGGCVLSRSVAVQVERLGHAATGTLENALELWITLREFE